jgi:hypothetical protein
MLEGFQLRDVPGAPCAVVNETTPLRVVADMVRGGGLEVVLMEDLEGGGLRGVVPGDSVLRMAARIPDAPLRLLPTQYVMEVPPLLTLLDALELISKPDVAALAQPGENGWNVVLREGLTGLDVATLEPVIVNREKRISGIR